MADFKLAYMQYICLKPVQSVDKDWWLSVIYLLKQN